jgi:hypothetical protein
MKRPSKQKQPESAQSTQRKTMRILSALCVLCGSVFLLVGCAFVNSFEDVSSYGWSWGTHYGVEITVPAPAPAKETESRADNRNE